MKNKLIIFKEVARHLSFTRAAENLFLSQPAISKAIRTLEEEYKRTFFLREGNLIQLTQDGIAFLNYAERILAMYADLENYFLNLNNESPELIKFGASSTVAQYILPKIIARSVEKSPNVQCHLKSGNSQEIEERIINQDIDFGIIEGIGHRKQLQYERFLKDEIVLVTGTHNLKFKSGVIRLNDLKHIPFVEREIGSGTREVIYKKLNEFGIKKLNANVVLSSTEAIKNYLYYSQSYALLSIHSISEDLVNNKLKIIDIHDITFERWFYFVSRQGYQSKLMDYFMKTIRLNYN